MTRQRAQADNAKLIATFAAAIAGGLVASALQAGSQPSRGDWLASWALGLTFVLTLGVMVLDRMEEPDHRQVLERAALATWTDDHRLFELRCTAIAACNLNERTLRLIKMAMWSQLTAAVFTGVLATLSMLLS